MPECAHINKILNIPQGPKYVNIRNMAAFSVCERYTAI